MLVKITQQLKTRTRVLYQGECESLEQARDKLESIAFKSLGLCVVEKANEFINNGNVYYIKSVINFIKPIKCYIELV